MERTTVSILDANNITNKIDELIIEHTGQLNTDDIEYFFRKKYHIKDVFPDYSREGSFLASIAYMNDSDGNHIQQHELKDSDWISVAIDTL